MQILQISINLVYVFDIQSSNISDAMSQIAKRLFFSHRLVSTSNSRQVTSFNNIVQLFVESGILQLHGKQSARARP